MKFWLLCLFALALPVVTAEETVPEGFQQWTADSLNQLERTLQGEALVFGSSGFRGRFRSREVFL